MSIEGANPERDLDRAVPDALVDALFDRELSLDAQREILGVVRHNAHTRSELERTAEALAALRDQPVAPDMTAQILARADGRRRFLPKRLRRLTRAARLGVSGAVLLVLLGVAGAQRAWPDALTLTPHDTPLADVNNAFRGDALEGVNSVRAGVSVARNTLTSFPRGTQGAGFVSIERVEAIELDSHPVRPANLTMVSLNAPPATVGADQAMPRRVLVGALFRFDARSNTGQRIRFERRIDPTQTEGGDPLRGVLP